MLVEGLVSNSVSNNRKLESYSERRRMLKDLEARNSEIARIGLRDLFGARGYYLYIQGYYKETLSYVEVEKGLRKVEKYIRDVEKTLKTLFNRQGSTPLFTV